MTELGGTADTISPGWFGFSAPAGTPRVIIARLAEEISKAMRISDIANRFSGVGLEPNTIAPDKMPAEMSEGIRADVPRFAKLVKALGIKPEY